MTMAMKTIMLFFFPSVVGSMLSNKTQPPSPPFPPAPPPPPTTTTNNNNEKKTHGDDDDDEDDDIDDDDNYNITSFTIEDMDTTAVASGKSHTENVWMCVSEGLAYLPNGLTCPSVWRHEGLVNSTALIYIDWSTLHTARW